MKKGFTLIELLVVTAFIGVLSFGVSAFLNKVKVVKCSNNPTSESCQNVEIKNTTGNWE